MTVRSQKSGRELRFRTAAAAILLAVTACRSVSNGGAILKDSGVSTVKTQETGSVVLVGNVPRRYLPGGSRGDSGAVALAAITVRDGIIQAIDMVDANRALSMKGQAGTIVLQDASGRDFDVIYPGMVNLHNHTKQNMLPLWDLAKGQFANRFEWRDWAPDPSPYNKAVSFNINPWIGTDATACAAFRWSELQAMVLGTTYLQGPSDCVSSFGILRVEEQASYLADAGVVKKASIQAPTDIVNPDDMIFVWRQLKPLIVGGMTYEQAIQKRLEEYCPRLMQTQPIADVNSSAAIKIFSDKVSLKSQCDSDPDKLIRYLSFAHATVAGKKNFLKNPLYSAIIVHLAEGRRLDPYNVTEFEMLRLLGLDAPGVNLVHAVAVDQAGLAHMAAKGMGLIWSPFSNTLLYGETVDIKAAREANVRIALGSDWTPTGSRGVLEEVKIARAYAERENLRALITDEVLYDMLIENPARMISHFEDKPGDGIHDIGTIAVDAAASLIAVRNRHANAYTNLVEAEPIDINLVVVNGMPVYGEPTYLTAYDANLKVESLPSTLQDSAAGNTFASLPVLPAGAKTPELTAHQTAVGGVLANVAMTPVFGCAGNKAYVMRESNEPKVQAYKAASGLDLDRPGDIMKLLDINLRTQSYNALPTQVTAGKGDPSYVVKALPPLYSCDDPAYTARFKGFIKPRGGDEAQQNLSNRRVLRQQLGLGPIPEKMAVNYGLSYDTNIDY